MQYRVNAKKPQEVLHAYKGIANTLGILEIIYIRFVAKKYTVETVESK